MKKSTKLILPVLLLSSALGATTGCDSPFIFIGHNSSMDNTTNTLFFALYNYYGFEGQHFTHRWLGMKKALAEYGVVVHHQSNDATTFTVDYTNSTLPKDFKVYMVNNQTWDVGLQFTTPLTDEQPLAVISTCNGVEFASAQIKAHSPSTQNATMGGFSQQYKEAMEEGSLNYNAAKYTCHVAPIFAAGVNNVLAMREEKANVPEANRKHKLMRVPAEGKKDGLALRLDLDYWGITSYEQYLEYEKADNSTDNPTIKKADLDPFFEIGNPLNSAEKLTEWVADSSYETVKARVDANRDVKDVIPTDYDKVKIGFIVPGSVNQVVGAYLSYCENYLTKYYNCEIVGKEMIDQKNTQKLAVDNLANKDAEFVISFQDDKNRNEAIKRAHQKHVFFANAGTCQNDADYEEVAKYKYFVGSVGATNIREEDVTYRMTKYYLDIINERGEMK